MENSNDEAEDSDTSLTDSSPKRFSKAEQREDETTCQSEKSAVLVCFCCKNRFHNCVVLCECANEPWIFA